MIRELFSNLQDYINGAMSREQFSVWFYGASRNAEKKVYGHALEFIYDLQLILAEASSANWSEDDLKEELADLLHEPISSQEVIIFGDSSLKSIASQPWVFGPLRM